MPPKTVPSRTSSIRKSTDPKKYVNVIAQMKNIETITWARGIAQVANGAICGILGLTGIAGFVTYVVVHVLISLLLAARMSFSPAKFVVNSHLGSFIVSGLTDNVVMFLLIWTLAYSVIHFYA